MTDAELMELHLRCCLHAWAYGSPNIRLFMRSVQVDAFDIMVKGQDQAQVSYSGQVVFSSMDIGSIECTDPVAARELLTSLRATQILEQLADL